MAFKIQLLSDVSGFLRGTGDVEKALDDVADSLDDLARDTKQNADKAADALEREFSDAMREVRKDTKKASKDMGDDLKHGAREAGEGFDDLKEEANDSAREAAASFSGEFDDVADYVQEVLAQALSGFGPIGAAAGIAAAAGIGFLVSSLQDAADKAKETQEGVADLAAELYDVNGNPAAIDYLSRIQELVGSIVDTKEWYEFWQPKNITWIEQQDKLWQNSNITLQERATLLRAQAGDINAVQDAQAILNAEIEREQGNARTWVDQYGAMHRESTQREKDLLAQRDAVAAQNSSWAEAKRQQEAVAEATRKSTEANNEFKDSLKDNASVLDEGLDKFRDKAKNIDFDKILKEQANRRKQNKVIIKFDAEAELSDAAKANFRKFSPEEQFELASAWNKGGKSRKKVKMVLEGDVSWDKTKVPDPQPINQPVQVDPNVKGAEEARNNAQSQMAANPVIIQSRVDPPTLPPTPATEPVVYRTKLDSSALPGDVTSARNKAQNTASAKKIEYRTRLNSNGLQAAVNRAAASIHQPTIYVKVKAKKEVE